LYLCRENYNSLDVTIISASSTICKISPARGVLP